MTLPIALLLSFGFVWFGAFRSGTPRPDTPALLLGAAATVGAGILTSSWRAHGVLQGAFEQGVVAGGVLFGAVPFVAYYVVGRLIGMRPALVGVWAILLPVLGLYLFYSGLFVAGMVHCPPNAYECPI